LGLRALAQADEVGNSAHYSPECLEVEFSEVPRSPGPKPMGVLG
jgi:hypothetical protein